MKQHLVTVLFLGVISCSAFAQTPRPTPVPKSDDIVRITTTLIQVDATVTDKKGNVVKDLTADDFEIYENGQKQKITNFSFIEPTATASATVGQGSATPNGVSPTEKIPPLPIKLRPEQIRRTIALVVDDLGLSFGTISRVKDSLKKYVDDQMQYGDLVAIIRTGAGAGFLQQFTSDKRILYKAIEQIRWNPSGVGTISIFRPIDASDKGAKPTADLGEFAPGPDQQQMSLDAEAAAAAFRTQQDNFADDVFAVGSLGAVNYVIQGMSNLPGRKALVYFSEGFKLYVSDPVENAGFGHNIKARSPRLETALQNLTEAANRSGVIIYPVDARGVVNGLMLEAGESFDDLNYSGGLSQMQTSGIERSTEIVETQQGLRALAAATGGTAFINNNDLSRGIEKALYDQSGYYLIGYIPNDETFDPKTVKFNKLEVKVSRPDLRVRYRSGFYGIRNDVKGAHVKTAREQIYGAIASPLNFSEFKLQLASVFANDAKTGNFIRTMIHIDGGSLTFTDEGNGWQAARYDVAALLFGEKDVVVDEVSRKQTIRARADTLNEIKEKGFVATILVPIKKPGAYQMRVVIRDDVSSRIGSASEFIQVPNIKKDQLSVSGLLLQRYDEVIAENSPRPFQVDSERDLALRTFKPGMRLRLGFGVYNAKVDGPAKSVDLSIRYRIFREGVEVYSSPARRVTSLDQSDTRRVLAEEDIKLSRTIKPGTYILQLIVRDALSQDKSRVTYQFTDFDVVAP